MQSQSASFFELLPWENWLWIHCKPELKQTLDWQFERIGFSKIGLNFSLIYCTCLKGYKSLVKKFSAILSVTLISFQSWVLRKLVKEVSLIQFLVFFFFFALILFRSCISDFSILESFNCCSVILFISDRTIVSWYVYTNIDCSMHDLCDGQYSSLTNGPKMFRTFWFKLVLILHFVAIINSTWWCLRFQQIISVS